MGAEDVVIMGVDPLTSVIDGNGWTWWKRFESLGLTAGRPHLIEPMFVKNFHIEGVWLKDSPFWTLHPYACTHVVIRGLRITADAALGHNTDGIDPDSCDDVLVEDCYVLVGDDAVAIKSGMDLAGRAFNRPSKNMLFRNCTFASKHVAMGSEESGGISNITIQDCVLGVSDSTPGTPSSTATTKSSASRPGIHLKSERGRGGYIRNITFERLTFVGTMSQPFEISTFYTDARNATNATATPHFANITLRDIIVPSVTGSTKEGWAGSLVGLPEAPIAGLYLHNVTVRSALHDLNGQARRKAASAWRCSDVIGAATDVTPPLPTGCFSPSPAPTPKPPKAPTPPPARLLSPASQNFPDIALVHCTNASTAANLQWEYNDMAFLIHWSSKLSMYALGTENQQETSAVALSDSVQMEPAQWVTDTKTMQLHAFRGNGIRVCALNLWISFLCAHLFWQWISFYSACSSIPTELASKSESANQKAKILSKSLSSPIIKR
jgi:hypothetical protein